MHRYESDFEQHLPPDPEWLSEGDQRERELEEAEGVGPDPAARAALDEQDAAAYDHAADQGVDPSPALRFLVTGEDRYQQMLPCGCDGIHVWADYPSGTLAWYSKVEPATVKVQIEECNFRAAFATLARLPLGDLAATITALAEIGAIDMTERET